MTYLASGICVYGFFREINYLTSALFHIVWLAAIFLWLYYCKVRKLSEIGFNGISKRHLIFALIFAAVFIPFDYAVYTSFCEANCARVMNYPKEVTFGELSITMIGMGFLVPIAEELSFRGIIQRELTLVLNKHIAIVVTSVLWAFAHLYGNDVYYVLWLMMFGVALGWIRFVSQSLVGCIVIHSLLNIFWALASYGIFV